MENPDLDLPVGSYDNGNVHEHWQSCDESLCRSLVVERTQDVET